MQSKSLVTYSWWGLLKKTVKTVKNLYTDWYKRHFVV